MPLNEKQNQRIGCAVIIAAAIGALFLGLWLGPFNGQVCQKDEYTGKKDCAVHNVTYVAAWEVGKALEDYSGAITGIATLLLAYITWKLAGLARDQSDTTKAQLRAYVSVIIGGAIAQDSSIGLRFRGDAILKNGGANASLQRQMGSESCCYPRYGRRYPQFFGFRYGARARYARWG